MPALPAEKEHATEREIDLTERENGCHSGGIDLTEREIDLTVRRAVASPGENHATVGENGPTVSESPVPERPQPVKVNGSGRSCSPEQDCRRTHA